MSVWIFGYGSLCWRPDFPFRSSVHGFVRGWRRRFWQHSTDHRGVPGAPGRVVTLIPDSSPASRVWGVAFEVDAADAERVLSALDYREKGGYVRATADVFHEHSEHPLVRGALVYLGTAENANYAGPACARCGDCEADLDAIARTIHSAAGPSGPNAEYLLRLAAFLRSIAAHDEHVFALEHRVRALAAPASGS
eukprot:tig00021759_g23428.t1